MIYNFGAEFEWLVSSFCFLTGTSFKTIEVYDAE